ASITSRRSNASRNTEHAMGLTHWMTPLLLAPLVGPPAPTCVLTVPAPRDARSVAVSPDGTIIAAAGADRMVRVWDLPAGKERAPFKLGSPISEIAFAPDGRHLASLAKCFERWDIASGKRDAVLPDASANRLAYASSGRLALAAHGVSLMQAGSL